MKTLPLFSTLLSLTALTAMAPLMSACDADDLDDEHLAGELDDDVEMRSGPAPVASTKWRIRNAAVQENSNVPAFTTVTNPIGKRERFPIQWRVRNATVQTNSGQIVLREMDFCDDPLCSVALADGVAFDSGASKSWSLPANAFDDDTSTMWKTFDASVAGQSYIGMDYGSEIVEPQGIYLKTDNVVYSVSSMYVEYFDVIAQQWVTSQTLQNLPAGSNVVRPLGG